MIDSSDKSTIISLFPSSIQEEKPGIFPGRFTIPASEGEPALLVVGQSVHHVDVGDDRPQLEVTVPSAQIARSVVDDFISAQIAVTENARPGLSWTRGEIALPELKVKYVTLLTTLRRQQKAWYLELVKMADDDWQRYRKHSAISDMARHAAKDLGYTDREWLIIPDQLASAQCPACGTSVVPSIVVCPSCRCVLDKEKYAKLTFAA